MVTEPLAAGNGLAASSRARPRLAYVINCFPNVIETMIYREIAALRALGYEIHIFSIRRPADADIPAEAREAATSTYYILPSRSTRVVGQHLRAFVTRPATYLALLGRVLFGTHDSLADRIRSLCHFAEGVLVVPELERLGIEHVHAHWATAATACAMTAAGLAGIPFSFTAHAYDIWRDKLMLPQKLAAARLTFTCTAHNRDHLVETYHADPSKVRVAHHGLNLDRFVPRPRPPKQVPTLLAVGRLVEQKGLSDLLEACALLHNRGVVFHCDIVGDGPLRPALEALARERSITATVTFHGRKYQEQLIDFYAAADLFVLPCIPASDDDRDGIPNTLIEACAMEVPIVSTRFSGIPELVSDGVNGLLVEPRDSKGLADTIQRLLSDAELRRKMGAEGRARVLRDFTLERAAGTLDGYFREMHANG